jgi:hypothetical protein
VCVCVCLGWWAYMYLFAAVELIGGVTGHLSTVGA